METGWTLDYIRSLPLTYFWGLVGEIKYQCELRDYRRDALLAKLIALNYKDVEIQDIIGEPPQRDSRKQEVIEIWEIAMEAGIRVPLKR